MAYPDSAIPMSMHNPVGFKSELGGYLESLPRPGQQEPTRQATLAVVVRVDCDPAPFQAALTVDSLLEAADSNHESRRAGGAEPLPEQASQWRILRTVHLVPAGEVNYDWALAEKDWALAQLKPQGNSSRLTNTITIPYALVNDSERIQMAHSILAQTIAPSTHFQDGRRVYVISGVQGVLIGRLHNARRQNERDMLRWKVVLEGEYEFHSLDQGSVVVDGEAYPDKGPMTRDVFGHIIRPDCSIGTVSPIKQVLRQIQDAYNARSVKLVAFERPVPGGWDTTRNHHR
ncbi:hypothetical protein B0T26DRAFT_745151 [Lasiosphaeria miniovina]|uniref:Uncharacterized protein n=1 Tax=Lasiosphaeria miniovina TaxID=1954250 RepID=A0AA40ECB5_9PEZI|nr:uncharacterized protein B0T26DRAFT_745151 [Lasiosphaeria miniovina]KAK0733057.1 hypothetical protein B0T26DRAFT_745151 [Lasiosphaeria miniovina]